jgi:predicted enzyme related to lactoylglutathione lyase
VVSAVLFARDLSKVAGFYREVFGVRASRSDTDHAVLDFGGFDLVIHQIPSHLVASAAVDSPPQRRERSAVRLDFPVSDIAHSRREANRFGGAIDDLPPPWAGGDTSFYLGYDAEGNVFGAKVANAP